MAYQNPSFVVLSYRGVYMEFICKAGKKSRVMAKAKAAYIAKRGKKAE